MGNLEETAKKQRYEKRIEHRFNPRFYENLVDFCHRFDVANLFFDDIVVDGKENVESVKDSQLFYVSNHVSLADFLIQGYVFGKDKLPIPRFIAGENLNHFPFGYIWKKCGAISVDRNMSVRNRLYWRVYDSCVKKPLLNGENLLNYGEGTRTGGRIRRFKTGTIGQVIDIVEQGNEILGVPIFIKYDKRVEDIFMKQIRKQKRKRDEALGQNKFVRASIHDRIYFGLDVLSFVARPFLTKGKVYLRFGKAFSISNFLEKTEGKKKIFLTDKFRQEIIKLSQ